MYTTEDDQNTIREFQRVESLLLQARKVYPNEVLEDVREIQLEGNRHKQVKIKGEWLSFAQTLRGKVG